MRSFASILGVAFSIILGQEAASQSFCGDVLKYAARDYSVSAQENSIAKRIYDQSCDGRSAKSADKLSFGLDAIVEQIPLKFNFGSSSSSEALSMFCKTFEEDFKQDSSRYERSSLVSTESVKAWSDCVMLYGNGISFNPIINTTQTVIEVTKKTADAVSVKGVQFDRNRLSCSVPDDDESDRRAAASMDTRKQLLDGGVWQVSCDRIPDTSGINPVYPEANITVHTTKGSFSMAVLADSVIGAQSASALNEQIDKLKSTVISLSNKSVGLECKWNTDSSPVMRNPTVVANIPPGDGPGWKQTGGGCEVGIEGGHWAPISYSGPNDQGGWLCIGRDPPNIPLNFSVKATIIYCKVVQQ